MILWPEDARVRRDGKAALEAFRATGACAELEASPERWQVTRWPWTRDAPVRLVFENDAHDELVVTIEEDGTWRAASAPSHVRERSSEELEHDARGDLTGERPRQPAHGT